MLNNIQILRAIAALLVVFAHFEFIEPAVGSFGVDIFFIISGFIMAYIVDKNPDAFLYRRLVRIVPIYWFMTLLTVALYLFKPTWFRNTVIDSHSLIKSLLFIPYRIDRSGPILSLGWTLNYEMFFYVLIAFFTSVFGSKRGMTICLVFLSLFVLTFTIFPTTNYVLAFYSGTIVLEFVFGSLLFYYWKQQKVASSSFLATSGIILGTISLGVLIIADHLYDPGVYRFLIFGIPAFLLTNMFLILEQKVNPKNKVHALAIELGNSSYAMYLVHPFVIYALIRLVFQRFKFEGLAFELTELIATLIIVCLVSLALHNGFEKPVMKKLKQLLDNRFDSKKSLKLSK